MTSLKCINCGLVNFATAANCKRCQQPINELAPLAQQRPYQQGTQPPPPPPQYGQGYQNQPPVQQYNQPQYTQQPPQQHNPVYSYASPPQQRMPDFNSPPPPPVFHEQQSQFQAHEMPPPPPVFQGQQPMYHPPQPPMNCVKCGNAHGANVFTFKKDYIPPLCYLGLLIGLLPMAILVSIFRRRHTIHAPFCGNCWKYFGRAKIVETLSALSFFLFIIIGAIVGAALNSGLVFFLFFAGFIGTAVYGQIYKKRHFPKFAKIDSDVVMIDTPAFGVRNFSVQQKMAL